MGSINSVARVNNPDGNNGRILLHGTYIGFVKNNQDSQKMGRLEVYIPELCGDPQNPRDWILVGYASMFAGSTDPNNVKKGDKTMAGTQSSYGWWGVPPDLNNQVLVVFVNGDLARGYWIGCVWQQEMNQMIPGIAAARTDDPDYKAGPLPPTVEYNKRDEKNPLDPTRAAFIPLAAGLTAQGLQADTARGPASASARRAAVAKVYGLVSPRGHQMYIDDDDANEFIRLRTRSGTQVLVNDTTGFVYINSALGNAWIEVSDAGIDIYSKGSISLRAEQDFNLRADNNILLDAGGSIFMRAGSDLNIQTSGQIVAGSEGALILSTNTKATLTVTGDFLTSVSGNQRSQTGADATLKAGGKVTVSAGGDMVQTTSGTIIRQAPSIQDNPGAAPSAPTVSPNPAQVPKPAAAPDVQGGKATTLNTIVNRMPTHEPWGLHPQAASPGKGASSAAGAGSSGSGAGSSSTSGSGASGAGSSGGGVSGTIVDSGIAALTANANTVVSQFAGTSVGDGQCVALIKAATGLGPTSTWRAGMAITPENVASVPPGTGIASFDPNGLYGNHTDHTSHGAVLLGPGTDANGNPGILVLDQWQNKPGGASTRVLSFNAANKDNVDNASKFSVINH